MAIYHFSGQVISRVNSKTGKVRSAVAAAAYRSGESLFDEKDGKTKKYYRKVMPTSFILVPKNAPEWANDRQTLWNEVEKVEKQYNSQLAREFNVALPVELSNKEQEYLVKEFCQKQFVDRGMVADISIHRDHEENPHFHVMLTVRPFNEDGSWGNKAKKVYLKDENGNFLLDEKGKRRFKKVCTTDWNSKKLFQIWRKEWSDICNQYLMQNGVDQKISHLSNETLNKEEIPQIHEGYAARKMNKEGKESDRIIHNKNVRAYNKKIVELREYKKEKYRKQRQNIFFRNFSPKEKALLSNYAKKFHMYINSENVKRRINQLDKWEKSVQFKKMTKIKLKLSTE